MLLQPLHCCGVRCRHLLLGFAVSAECVFCFWHSAVGFCCGVGTHTHTTHTHIDCCHLWPFNVCMSPLYLIWFILIPIILV